MSIQTRCPHCDAPYSLAESQRGKKVRCKKCSEIFVVSEEGGAPAAAGKTAKVRKDAVADAPRAAAKAPPARTRPPAVRRDRDRDREDDDEYEDDRPARRAEVRKKSGSPVPLILIIGGGILLLFLLCGGGAIIAAYYWGFGFGSGVVDNISQQIPNGPNGPIFDPNANQPPPDRVVPDSLDTALAWARNGDTEHQIAAANWVANAEVDDGRRKEVASALEHLLPDLRTHDAALAALGKWAGPENVPALVREADKESEWGGNRMGGPAADALVRLQDDRAVPVFTRRLEGWHHDEAEARLALYGAKAEPEVLKYMDDPNQDARSAALKLLAQYGTKPEAMLNQAVMDLKSPVPGYDRGAADYLAKVPVDETRRAEVAKGLEGVLSDKEAESRKAAVDALKVWGTKDNVPALIAEMNRGGFGFGGASEEAMDALAKLQDPRGAEAIAAHLKDFGPNRDAAARALRLMGAIAEKAVLAYVNDPDEGVRTTANDLLKSFDTKSNTVLDAAVADLASTDPNKQKAAAETLASQPLDKDQQDKVARALEKVVASDAGGFFGGPAEAAAKALGVWADKKSIPVLLRALQTTKGDGTYKAILDALVKSNDEQVVVPLLVLYADKSSFFHKDDLKRAITQLGPLVETALDDIVADPSAKTEDRIGAINILIDPGNSIVTAKSLPALQTASMDKNALVKARAAQAYKTVKAAFPGS